MIGINYYIEPEAKEYINKQKMAQTKIAWKQIPINKTIEEGQNSSKKPTYKECLVKGVDPLDGEYIDLKIEEKIEKIYPEWKKEIKL
jgi:hypothetical protein